MGLTDIWSQKEFVLFVLQILLFIVQVLGLVFLGIYVWKTWEMASATRDSARISEKMLAEMKEARDQESAPYVVPYINISQNMISFGIKNIGKTVAKNIKINVEPELKSSRLAERIKDMSLIKNGLSSLPPGHEISTIFDVFQDYFSRNDFPLSYLVKITYTGGLRGELREHEQILDLSVYKDLIPDNEMKLDDLVNMLGKLVECDNKTGENLQKIAEDVARGIWLKNPEFLVSNYVLDATSWRSIAASKLKELKVLLELKSKGTNYSYSVDMKNRMDSLVGQILVIAASYPPGTDSKIVDDLNSFASDILEFSRSLAFKVGVRMRQNGSLKELQKFENYVEELIRKLN